MLARLERKYTEEGNEQSVRLVQQLRRLNNDKDVSVWNYEQLAAQWKRQGQRYVDLQFHTALGLNYREYINSLPTLSLQKEEHVGLFERPILVEARIPWQAQAKLAGIDVSRLGDLSDAVTNYFQPPEEMYVAWMQNIRVSPQISAVEAQDGFGEHERGAIMLEGIAHAIMYPEDLKNEGMILPGVQLGTEPQTVVIYPEADRLAMAPIMLGESRPGLHAMSVGA